MYLVFSTLVIFLPVNNMTDLITFTLDPGLLRDICEQGFVTREISEECRARGHDECLLRMENIQLIKIIVWPGGGLCH